MATIAARAMAVIPVPMVATQALVAAGSTAEVMAAGLAGAGAPAAN